MTVPGFNAEASLYETSEHYRLSGGGLTRNGTDAVVPQGCGFFDFLTCVGFAGTCIALCYEACTAGGPVACAACVSICLPAVAYPCKDCIISLIEALTPGSGGGGGGPALCCPSPNRPYCCGTCRPLPDGGYHCDGTCVENRRVCLGLP
jgi:hypothetical protein